ncbi:MAG: hypothetical protein ACK5QX_09890 [bacterium]|jgi:hypothetical protein
MRARNIKPGFFSNDLLPECEPLARLLFIGLWCMADKAGRLEDRPKKIKIDVLPCDDCDIESMLRQLEKHRFIVRYAMEDARYIQVVNFEKHQNPHCKEKASTIPAPCAHRAGTVHPPDTPDTGPADSLIPDMRIPEPSLTSDSRKRMRKRPAVELAHLCITNLPREWAEWAHHEMGWNAATIHDIWINFRDYWLSRNGKAAQKSDWAATWRNWCRQQNIRNGGKHAATFNHTPQGARPSKSERFKHALIDSTLDELGAE